MLQNPPLNSGWLRERVDLRSARRRDRARWAVIANLFYGAYILVPNGDRETLPFMLLFVSALGLMFTLSLYSFVDVARRTQLDALVGKLSVIGCHVVCHYFDGELELGVDQGWLGRHGGGLRFEGVTSRFFITREIVAEEPNHREFVVKVDGRPIRVALRGQKSSDMRALEEIWHAWSTTDVTSPDVILPPTSPQTRPWDWYITRALDKLGPSLGLTLLLAWFIKGIFVPESLTWLRWSLLFVPLAIYLIMAMLIARQLKRRDAVLIAALSAPADRESMVVPEAPLPVSNAV